MPAARGIPQIEVTFDIDANGILNVSAKDKGTNKEQSITITASSGLSQDEIDQMINDAELHADEDQKKRESVELKNNAQGTIFAAESMLKDNEDKITDDIKEEIQGKITELSTALESDDPASIEASLQNLNSAIQQVGQEIYSNPEAPTDESPQQEDTSPDSDDDNTVEGEFRQV